MLFFEILSLLIAIISCGYFTYTDLKYNLIKNRFVLLVSVSGLVISVIEYVFFARILFPYYLINLGIAVLLSVALYATHIWAAGDSKMYICMAFLMPATISLARGRVLFSGLFIAAWAFAVGFLYLLFDTFRLIVKKEIVLNASNFVSEFKRFLFNYIKNIAILSGLWAIESAFQEKTGIELGYTFIVVNMLCLILLSFLKDTIKNVIAVSCIIVDVIVFFVTGLISFKTINVRYYGLIVLFMIFRILVSDGNYATISSADVKKGMILSTVTTMLMQSSKIKGLPRLSKENMADRLTEEEAEAVRKWGQYKGKTLNVQIVKKVPFAIFLTLGMIIDIAIWGINNFANP